MYKRQAYGRTVTIDLGASMSVDGVAMEFLQNKEHGVYCPRTLTVSLSENGTDFETVATVEKPVSNTANGRIRVPYTADFENARARDVYKRQILTYSWITLEAPCSTIGKPGSRLLTSSRMSKRSCGFWPGLKDVYKRQKGA